MNNTNTSDHMSLAPRLLAWVASAREKFNLPQTEEQHFKSPHWDGYEACLQDLERFLKENQTIHAHAN